MVESLLLTAIAEILGLDREQVEYLRDVDRGDIPQWDSLAHIQIYVIICEITKTEYEFGKFMSIRSIKEIFDFARNQ